MKTSRIAIVFAAVVIVVGCASFPNAEETRSSAEKMVMEAFPGMPEALTRRAVQDPAQRICSKVGDTKLTSEEGARVVQASGAAFKYPASNKLAGDWKIGAKLAADGGGLRVRGGQVEKLKENGGLCVNCHALDPNDVNVGNLGPSLTGYGTRRGNSEAAVKYTYEKIYNAWATFPCSNMPRLGHNGFLTPEQITHVVAYLVDPQSPVNRK